MATGRTVGKNFKFQIEDSGGTLRDIAVETISVVGLDHEESAQTSLADAIRSALSGHPVFAPTITGPLSNQVVVAASGTGAVAAYSGSHVVLSAVNGLSVPLGFACYFGIQAVWATNDPVFGLAGTSANGILVTGYTVDPVAMTYSAKLNMFPGSAAPAWGTTAIT